MSAKAKPVMVEVVDARKPPLRVPPSVFDAVNARLCKIEAIARLLMDVDPTGMAPGGLADTAWAIVDFTIEAHDLMAGKTEVQS